jgi:hypothetical protein
MAAEFGLPQWSLGTSMPPVSPIAASCLSARVRLQLPAVWSFIVWQREKDLLQVLGTIDH